MTPDERIDIEERIGIIWDGAPSKEPVAWAEAERIARAQIDIIDAHPDPASLIVERDEVSR